MEPARFDDPAEFRAGPDASGRAPGVTLIFLFPAAQADR
jgi:hypothetical protein